MSIGHSASGLRAYARVIPAGFIGHHRGDRTHVALHISAVITDGGFPLSVSEYSPPPARRRRRRHTSLIKSHRVLATRTRRPRRIFSSCSQCQRRGVCISRSRKLRFTILALERTDRNVIASTRAFLPRSFIRRIYLSRLLR